MTPSIFTSSPLEVSFASNDHKSGSYPSFQFIKFSNNKNFNLNKWKTTLHPLFYRSKLLITYLSFNVL